MRVKQMISEWIGIVVGAVVVFALAWKVIYGGSGGSGLKGAVVKEKIKMGAMAIDVRSPAEYQSGHYREPRTSRYRNYRAVFQNLGTRIRPSWFIVLRG